MIEPSGEQAAPATALPEVVTGAPVVAGGSFPSTVTVTTPGVGVARTVVVPVLVTKVVLVDSSVPAGGSTAGVSLLEGNVEAEGGSDEADPVEAGGSCEVEFVSVFEDDEILPSPVTVMSSFSLKLQGVRTVGGPVFPPLKEPPKRTNLPGLG